MDKILQIRKSVWAAICIWLGLVRGYEAPAQPEPTPIRLHNTVALNVFNVSMSGDWFFRLLGKGADVSSFESGPIMQNSDQPKVSFVGRLQQSTRPAIIRTTNTTSCTKPTPPPPPLPPVSTLPTAAPVPPLTCTAITEQFICTSILNRTRCHTNVCCIRGGSVNHCAKVSSYSYTTRTHFHTTWTSTTCVTHLSCVR